MKQYGFNGSYYNEEMSSVKTLDLLPRYIYMSYSSCHGGGGGGGSWGNYMQRDTLKFNSRIRDHKNQNVKKLVVYIIIIIIISAPQNFANPTSFYIFSKVLCVYVRIAYLLSDFFSRILYCLQSMYGEVCGDLYSRMCDGRENSEI